MIRYAFPTDGPATVREYAFPTPTLDQLREVFMTEDGDELFVPTAAFSWNAAQHEARGRAIEYGDEWSKAVYAGTREVEIHIGCDWPDGCRATEADDDGLYPPYAHPPVRCYCFEVGER